MPAESFEAFVAREFAALGRFANALTGDRYLAEDLLAEALLKVSVRWRRVGRMEHPAAYTRRVVLRNFLSHRRRASTQRETVTAEVPEGAVRDHGDTVADREQVRQLLDRLTPQQRAAVTLRYLVDLDDEQIGAELSCSAATVRSHLSHARRVLRLANDDLTAQDQDPAPKRSAR